MSRSWPIEGSRTLEVLKEVEQMVKRQVAEAGRNQSELQSRKQQSLAERRAGIAVSQQRG